MPEPKTKEKKMSEETPNAGARYGVFMIAGFAGAIVLFILKALPNFFAFIAGGLLLFFGYGILASKKEKIAGITCLAAGALTLLSVFPVIKHPASWLLQAGAIALLALGVWNGIRFVLNLKKR
jgi:asparagine N-glycosylation enzyme membrane subunit Stt3